MQDFKDNNFAQRGLATRKPPESFGGIIQSDVNKDQSLSEGKNRFNKHLADRNLHSI